MNRIRLAAVGLVLGCALAGTQAEAKAKAKTQVTGVLNINQATSSQIDLLPGVGAKAALRIIEYRKKTPFNRPEELVKVKGFGKKRFDALKPHLTVAGPTTLQVQKVAAAAPTQARGSSPSAR